MTHIYDHIERAFFPCEVCGELDTGDWWGELQILLRNHGITPDSKEYA